MKEKEKAILIPVENRPGVYTYEAGELKLDPKIAIKGEILLYSKRLK